MDTDTLAPEAPPEVASEVVDRVQLVNGHAVVEFTKTEQALADLRQRYANAAFDLTTTKGNEAARAARKELVGLRTALEARRKEFKAPVLAMGQVIDQKAKTITEAILALETPIDQQIKADEARREEERRLKAEAEAKRVAMLRERLNYMRSIAVRAVGKPSTEVQAKIDLLDRTVIGDDFAEFREEAHVLRDEVLGQLRNMLAAVLAQEAEAKRLAEEREAQARRAHYVTKLTELRGLSIGMASKPAVQVAEAIAAIEGLDMRLEAWGDAETLAAAQAAHAAVLGELQTMKAAAEERERIATEQAAEARRLEEQRAEQQRQQEAIDAAARRQAEEEFIKAPEPTGEGKAVTPGAGNTEAAPIQALQPKPALSPKSHPTHGYSQTAEYRAWQTAMKRCTDPENAAWDNYGGRGITMCDRWLTSVVAFIEDMGAKPSELHELDRVDNDKGYEPGNCRWVLRSENNRNKSNNRIIEWKGQEKTLVEWSEITGLSYWTLRSRLDNGWPVDRAMTEAPATADATDRDAPAVASPSGGSMGAKQSAAADPAGGFLIGAFTVVNDPANPEKTRAEIGAAIARLDGADDVRVIETPPLPASDAVPSIKLGDLCTWAGVTMTRAFVEGFGITPTVEGRAILFTPAQRRALKAALVEHFEGLPV